MKTSTKLGLIGLALLAGCAGRGNIQQKPTVLEPLRNKVLSADETNPIIACSNKLSLCEKPMYENFAGLGNTIEEAKENALEQIQDYFRGVGSSTTTTTATISFGRSSNLQTNTQTTSKKRIDRLGSRIDYDCKFPLEWQYQGPHEARVIAYCPINQ